MNELFFPSCNFTKASPEASRRLDELMAGLMPAAGCCRVDPLDCPDGTTAVCFCQNCRAMLTQRAGGRLTVRNLFVRLLVEPGFPFPDYSGMTVTVQDCWRDREHPEVFDAVRECLRRMNVTVVEMEPNRERSGFCGDFHFEPQSAETAALLRDVPLASMNDDQLRLLMAEQAAKFPCETVVTCCNRCTKLLRLGGVRAIHLVELITGTV